MSDLTKELEGYDDDYAGAPEPKPKDQDRPPVPDGSYTANIEEAEVTRSKGGDLMVKWTLKITGPKCAGRLQWKYSMISSGSMEYLKQDLFAVGLKSVKVSQLPAALPRVVGAQVRIGLKTKDGTQRLYLNGLAKGEEVEDGAPPPDDDSFPF